MYLVVDQPEIVLPELDQAEPVVDQPEQHRVADNKLPRRLGVLKKLQ